MSNTETVRFLRSRDDKESLSKVIGDCPEMVICNHVLKRGNCSAWIKGDLPHYSGVVVQAQALPSEPWGFGTDEVSMWRLLQHVKGWNCILVHNECASALGRLITQETGLRTRYLSDINYQLSGDVSSFSNPAVRVLTLEDRVILESAPPELRGGFWKNCRSLLTEGYIAGAVVEGKVVGTAFVSSMTHTYADIGVFTLPDFRNRGFAIAAASTVAKAVKVSGRTPVWSTGENNAASRKVADMLGFIEIMRRTYVVLQNAPAFSAAGDVPTDA